jgi:hypothetical protein
MTSLWRNENTTIGRVTIRSRAEDPLTAQQRVDNLLRSAGMRQSRLPPSSILFVRKLQDPLPDNRWLSTNHLHLPQAWEQAVTRELDRLAGVAVRPLFDAVPPSAEAVVFRDQAELLACLTEDWLRGTLPANWWWHTLLRSGDLNLIVMREWERSPELVPAGIDLLQRRSRALEFVRRLPESCTARLVAGMLRSHGLIDPRVHQPRAKTQRPSEVPVTGKHTLKPPPLTHSIAHPWLPWVAEASAPDLTPDARLLLAYALLLKRAPHIARAPEFATRVSEWREGIATGVQLPENPATVPKTRSPAAWQTQRDEGNPSLDAGNPQRPATGDVVSAESASLAARPDAQVSLPAAESAPAETPGSAPTEGAATEDSPPPASAFNEVLIEQPPQASVSPPAAPETGATTDPQDLSQTEVETEFGGAFFLLNLASYLNLYGDFTKPRHRGLELNIWDFVALFGAELGGSEFAEDRIWAVLAELAGRRPGQKPGKGFHPPDAWRVPIEWLDAFPEPEPWRATTPGNKRLRLTHPAGFCVVDVPLRGRTSSHALAEELQPYSAAVSPIEEEDTEPAGTPLTRWIAWMGAYLRARLMRALGRTDAAELLCRIPARLRITPAHLHVLIRLDRHPIEIRLAALDRDPGWIPAAGRYVAFHFN